MRRGLGGFVLAVALIAVGCSTQPTPTEKPSIVVTTSILGDVVSNVVGDRATVEVLMPAGADAHDFQASAAQVARIHNADLVVANGLGLEEGLAPVLAAAAADGVRVFELAPRLNPIPFVFGHDDHDDEDEDEDEADHDHDLDPHVWMDPVRMAEAGHQIAFELEQIDPETDWMGPAKMYYAKMIAVHREIEQMLGTVAPADRKMVTNHASFGYFADRYGWEVVGTVIPGGSSLGAPSSADLAELVAGILAEDVGVIFVETSSPDDLARVVAAEVGRDMQVVTLHTESLGDPPADTLVGMLEENARLITQALTE